MVDFTLSMERIKDLYGPRARGEISEKELKESIKRLLNDTAKELRDLWTSFDLGEIDMEEHEFEELLIKKMEEAIEESDREKLKSFQ